MKTIYELIGENLKKERQANQISMKKLSDTLQISIATYRKIESGSYRISPYQLHLISKELNISMDALMLMNRPLEDSPKAP